VKAPSRLTAIRRRAESRMLDTFEIREYDDGYTYDETEGEDVRTYETLFTTAGRVKVEQGLSVRDPRGRRTHRVIGDPDPQHPRQLGRRPGWCGRVLHGRARHL
jgi:hypothetical protein